MTTKAPRTGIVTSREREVLCLVAGHLTNAEIAAQLCVSIRTVETHVSSLMRKLRASDRRHLARQAEASGLTRDRTRWPGSVTTFVGREAERRALGSAVSAHRMVTVTGPGGVGKTRLAIEVAQQIAATRRDGGWFVDLVQVTDPAMVIAAVAAAVGVVEQPGGSLDRAVANALAASDALIVLDNCEHLVDAARSCVELLLTSCPSLTIAATSRTRLVAPFEWVYSVPGLSVTEDGGDAVTLFLDRARAAGGGDIADRDRVGALCRALDGIALAIELAAARYPSLGLDGLHAGLDHRLRVLASGTGAVGRHRSLRDAIAWSVDLLTVDDRTLLCGVSVFASWFGVDAARVVSLPEAAGAEVADGLARLVEHNLLVAEPGDPTRYRALETIRQYGEGLLARDGESESVHDRHRRWCLAQISTLAGEQRDEAWYDRFDRVAADARAALVRPGAHQLDPVARDLAERFAEELLLRGRPAESQHRFEQAAEHAPTEVERARLLRLAAGAAAARLVGDEAVRLLRAAASVALGAGDRAMAAGSLAWIVIYALMAPGIIATPQDPEEVRRTLEDARSLAHGSPAAEAAVAAAIAAAPANLHHDAVNSSVRAVDLARRAASPLVENVALDQLCAIHLARAEYGKAIEVIGRRGQVLDDLRLDASSAYQLNDYLLMGSEVHLAAGDLRRAAAYADRLAELACYREQEHPALARRIKVDALAGDLDAATARGDRFLVAWERAGRHRASTLAASTYAMAMVHGLLGSEPRRQQWSDITRYLLHNQLRLGLDDCATGWAPTMDAVVALDVDRPDLALDRLSADIDDPLWQAWNTALWRPWYAALWAEAAVLAGRADAGTRLERSIAATWENPIAAAIVRRAGDLAGGDLDRLHAHANTFGSLGCHYQRRRTQQLLDGKRSAKVANWNDPGFVNRG